MRLRFTKMQGLGNDFVVIDGVRQQVTLSAGQVRWLADRHFGIGCDQLLLVEPAAGPGVDFRYRIFNADGGEVSQCGNGARCFARFVREQGLTDKDRITVATRTGRMTLQIQPDDQVTVAMGAPRWAPAEIPFTAGTEALRYPVTIAGRDEAIGAVSLGNPHALLQVVDVDHFPVAEVGARIGADPRFPEGVNVGFMQPLDRHRIRLRVFERGAGETLACGSGACAAVVIGQRWGLLERTVQVELAGGTLTVDWPGGAEQVMMTGPAARVFEGEIEL